MFVELLGWLSTALVLIGFGLNSKGKSKSAIIFWILGDIGWITYDIFISNFSHMVLSFVIIMINIIGYRHYKLLKKGK